MLARVLLAVVTIASIARSARADEPKQKIAVLGIEVVGTVDAEATTIAHNLTEQLRIQVAASPRFVVAPNSTKELFDEKLASGCDTEATACMLGIAKKFRAKRMLFGRLEKKTNNGPGYQVSLKLLDVDRSTMTPWSDFIPLAETGPELDGWAKRGFTMVTGQDDTTQVVVSEPDHGTPPPPPPEHSSGQPHNGWRTWAYVTTPATVLLAGGFFYSWNQLAGLGKKGTFSYGAQCTPDPAGPGGFTADSNPRCVDGSSLRIETYATGIGMAVVGTVAVVAIYRGFIRKQPRRDELTGKPRRASSVVLTPVVSPGGAGAIVHFDW
jgi:hypothetical protein